MKKGKIVGDVFRYIIGSIIVICSIGFLLSKDTIISGIFMFISGITTMPFIFRLLGKAKIPRGLLIAMAISIPIISFFISAFTVPIDENESRINAINTVLNQNIKKKNREKENEIIRIDESDKYKIIIHVKYSKAYDYNAVCHYAMNYIEKIKNNKYNPYVNDNINDYTINFYKDGFLTYTVTYNNDNEQNIVNQLTILNTSTNESSIYTKENDQNYIAALNEQKRASMEEKERSKKQKQEEESNRKAQENRKKDTKVIHNLGETVSCIDFDVSVDSYQIKPKGTYIDSYQYIDDPEWIGIIVTVRNKTDETHTFNSSNFTLQNSNGEVITHRFWNYDIWGIEMFNSPKLVGGGTKTGYISYTNTNQDNSNLIVQVKCEDVLFEEDTVYKFSLK